MPRLRFRVRSLMIIVAIVGLSIALGPRAWRVYRCRSFHRSQAAKYLRLEQKERLREAEERVLSADRAAIRAELMKTKGFEDRSPADQEKEVFAAVFHHRVQSKLARLEAVRLEEIRRDNEDQVSRCWDPSAPTSDH